MILFLCFFLPPLFVCMLLNFISVLIHSGYTPQRYRRGWYIYLFPVSAGGMFWPSSRKFVTGGGFFVCRQFFSWFFFFSGVKLLNFIVSMYIYSFSILCCRCCCDIRFSSPISYMHFVAHCLIIFFVLPFAASISLAHRCVHLLQKEWTERAAKSKAKKPFFRRDFFFRKNINVQASRVWG